MNIKLDNIVLSAAAATISETKTIAIDCTCSDQAIYMTWMNYLGGFDYWLFTAQKEYQTDIKDAQTKKTNIITDWPRSYGEFADSIETQTARESRQVIVVKSQHLTLSQLNAIKYIKTSPVVQVVTDKYSRRTVLVDTDSFKEYDESEKLYGITFKITYTDSIPSQQV